MKHKIQIIIAAILAVLGVVLKIFWTGHDYLGYLCILAAGLIVLFAYAGKKLRIVAACILALGLVVFVMCEVPVIREAKTDAPENCEYLVVLGAGVRGDVPSLSLVYRLEAALEYLEQNPGSVAIVTGGQGPGENITEAEAMSIWLEARGVDPERIIKEEKATSTMENLTFSYDIIRRRGGEPEGNVAIVSSEYHLCRAKLMSESLGVPAYGVAAETEMLGLRINYFIREALAVGFYKLVGGI